MSTVPPIVANLGGEEGDRAWQRAAELAPVRAARAAFGALFDSNSTFAEPFGGTASPHAEPAFDWLRGETHRVWYDPNAAGVAQTHDKAFAVPFAGRPLEKLIGVYSPSELARPDEIVSKMTQHMSAWPEALRERFCLKPRIGSSGRGRVAGRAGDANTAAIRGALPRLAKRGGALLEPWLARRDEVSVALYAGSGATPLSMLGSLDAIVTDHGVPVGHSGEIDNRGRVYSRSIHDDDVRAAAAEIASEAVALGFRGPCGIDAFSYATQDEDGRPHNALRPVVEFNARFTMGIVALGALRRARTEIKEALSVSPGERIGFIFATSNRKGWNAARAELKRASAGAVHWSPVATALPLDAESGPAILAAREPDALSAVIALLREAGPS